MERRLEKRKRLIRANANKAEGKKAKKSVKKTLRIDIDCELLFLLC